MRHGPASDNVENAAARADSLSLAVRCCVAGADGLGGMLHVSEGALGLRLLTASGMDSEETARRWRHVPADSATAPAVARREGAFIWRREEPDGPDHPNHPDGPMAEASPPDAHGPDAADHPGSADHPGHPGHPDRQRPPGGMMSVPLTRGGETLGVFTVVMATANEPGEPQVETVRAAAPWLAALLEDAHTHSPDRQWSGPRGVPGDSFLAPAYTLSGVGAFSMDLANWTIDLDDTAMALAGVDRETYDGRVGTLLALVHPDDDAMVRGTFQEAIEGSGRYEVEHRVRRGDRTARWLQSRGQVLPGTDGAPRWIMGTVWDSTESRAARDGIRRALRDMGDGFLSMDADWRIIFANVEAEHLMGLEGRLTGRTVWDIPVVRQVPGLEARSRATAGRADPAVFDIEWPSTRRWYRIRLVPVPDGLAWYFTDITDRRRRKAEEASAARASTRRSARIQELTAALAEAVTAQDVVNAVASRVLPPFGASGLVVSSVESGRLRVVGAQGYRQDFLDKMDGLPLLTDTGISGDINRRQPWFVSSREEYERRYPQLGALPLRGVGEAWAFLPLVVSGQLVGLCVIAFDRPRRLKGEDRALLIALSGLVSQALERARLYDAEHARAQEFQRGLLPQGLPPLPAAHTAARYVSAGGRTDVGGDWYDVIPLSADRVALVIGDVMGHGLSQAVTMARLRTAVRTLSNLELPPDEILGHLNDLVVGLGDDSFVTCLYAIYDPISGTCDFARAGHLPPALVTPDGSASLVPDPPDPPLGAAEPPFSTVELSVPDGSELVFCTDGLVEGPRGDMEGGLRTLIEVLRTHHDEDVERLSDTITQAFMVPDLQRVDDAALLVARVHATDPGDVVTWPLPEDPRAAGAARGHAQRQLEAWDLEHLAMTTELVVSELVGNAVRHASGPLHLRLIRSSRLICEVADGSETVPRIQRASWNDEGGRGLQLVATMCERWGTRYTRTGKTIWTEQLLA